MIYMLYLKRPSHKIFSNILIGKHVVTMVITMVINKVKLCCFIVKGYYFHE